MSKNFYDTRAAEFDRLPEATHKLEAERKAELRAALDSLDKPGYPAGWGTSPRPAPTAASYKPAHGGYPGTTKLRNPQPFC